MPEFDVNMVIAVIFALLVLFYLLKILAGPAKIFVRFVLTGVVGAAILLVFNLVAGFFSMTIGVNAATALIVGYMGLPGLAMLVIIQRLLG